MKSLYLDTLLLLSDSLHNRISTHIDADNWPGVFSELQAHSVTSLVAQNLESVNFSAEDKLRFMKILGVNLRKYNSIVLEQNKVLSSLNDADIKVVVLKGTSAAKYYPNPKYRAMGDIDILVNPKDFDKAHTLLDALGYTAVAEEEKNGRHVGFHNSNGLGVELHRYFSGVGSDEKRDYLDKRLYDALEHCENNVLPEVENGLVLIGHIALHLRSGLGLRQIIDWLMYAEANLTDEFWNEKFYAPAQGCGFDTLAKVTTALCRKYLGLSRDISWCDDVDDELIDSFMEYIMEQGNFGRKHKRGQRNTAAILTNFRNPVTSFKYLQARGKAHWKLARTNKFIGCFAWIYQIGRFIRMGFRRKVGILNLKNINDKSKGIVKLMDELDIDKRVTK